jgi:hypothetical protein
MPKKTIDKNNPRERILALKMQENKNSRYWNI